MVKRVPKEAAVIGKNLKRIRKFLGLSQTKMGETIHVSFQQMQKYENGQNRLPAEKIYYISVLFDIPIHSFFIGMPEIEPLIHRDDAVLFPQSSVMHTVHMMDNNALKRKIERITEILLGQ